MNTLSIARTTRLDVRWAALTLLAFLLITGGALAAPARAADPPAGAPVFANVDLQKILNGYSKKATFDQQLKTMNQQLSQVLQQQGHYGMLSEQDQQQLGTLLAKPGATADDQAQIAALEQKSDQATQQLAALQQKQNPTAADQSQMTQLIQQQKDGQTALQDIANGYQDQMQQKSDQLSQQLSQDVKAAITTIAKQRGYSVVFDSQVAIYTANDITDDVLKVLNK